MVAVDLAASGISTVKVEEIQSFEDYSKPLLEVLSSDDDDEQVIIVAHSMGGITADLVLSFAFLMHNLKSDEKRQVFTL